jgi:(1->4)-alpha-D-glucan 1-alpha-D-glucosylmutase
VEDTAFYIYNPLVSLNEVGGNPEKFGASVEEFHQQNIRRRQVKPCSFITTSTHDSKRGEDVRARINVLSEIPKEWKSALTRWHRLNKNRRETTDGQSIPDSNEEYLLYQTLLGTFLVKEIDDKELAEYHRRVQNYILKAIREAKVHTSWISPNDSYEESVNSFVSAILEPSLTNQFMTEFTPLNKLVAAYGIYNSLSQTVLKIFSPGVPDIYQGNELLAFDLTDPDNRRPVDFKRCRRMFNGLKKQLETSQDLTRFAERLSSEGHDGQAKLYVVWRSLKYRRDNADLFGDGDYLPLTARGAKKDYLCSFAWQIEKQRLVVAAPRLVAGLTGNTGKAPMGMEVWGNTYIVKPKSRVEQSTGTSLRARL